MTAVYRFMLAWYAALAFGNGEIPIFLLSESFRVRILAARR